MGCEMWFATSYFLPPTPFLFKIPRHLWAGGRGAGGKPAPCLRLARRAYEGRGQGLGRLGPVGSTGRPAYTPGLSTRYSSGVLTRLTLWEASSWGGLPA